MWCKYIMKIEWKVLDHFLSMMRTEEDAAGRSQRRDRRSEATKRKNHHFFPAFSTHVGGTVGTVHIQRAKKLKTANVL